MKPGKIKESMVSLVKWELFNIALPSIVRKRAGEIVQLLSDTQAIKAERIKAKSNKTKYKGYASASGSGSGSSPLPDFPLPPDDPLPDFPLDSGSGSGAAHPASQPSLFQPAYMMLWWEVVIEKKQIKFCRSKETFCIFIRASIIKSSYFR